MKKIRYFLILIIATNFAHAQGCSDAGFCTAGNFNAHDINYTATAKQYKNEFDISFYYATHNKNEKFFQPQINWRRINKRGAFFELRVPLNYAKDNNTNISTTGIGDIIATYNSQIHFNKKTKFDYSAGLRVSLSHSDKSAPNTFDSYPMYLQTGLGTTDLIAVVNYNLIKYISIGSGVQVPLIQYNHFQKYIQPLFIGNLVANEYHRKADALIKLTGHYNTGKFTFNGGLLAIYHLANDYYKLEGGGKYTLDGSKGTTINFSADISYAFSKRCSFNLLYAEPLQTRTNIPDGLARSRVIVPKVTVTF